MKNNPVIEVKNVTMKFNLMEEKVDSLKEYVVRFLKGNLSYDAFTALDNVSFDIYSGEVVGLVGFNGAGKSTMLKIIAGVLKPTSGEVTVRGKIAPLIEVGAGFDPELTAKENIYLNGAILGHSKEFLDEHMENIVEFAEIKKFLDVPVKNFSSGMYARLGFSIATEVKPDILIVDEVLAVGDARFKEKCRKRIEGMIAEGTTVLLVTHDLNTVRQICNRAVWFGKGQYQGKIRIIGDAKIVCDKFQAVINSLKK